MIGGPSSSGLRSAFAVRRILGGRRFCGGGAAARPSASGRARARRARRAACARAALQHLLLEPARPILDRDHEPHARPLVDDDRDHLERAAEHLALLGELEQHVARVRVLLDDLDASRRRRRKRTRGRPHVDRAWVGERLLRSRARRRRSAAPASNASAEGARSHDRHLRGTGSPACGVGVHFLARDPQVVERHPRRQRGRARPCTARTTPTCSR